MRTEYKDGQSTLCVWEKEQVIYLSISTDGVAVWIGLIRPQVIDLANDLLKRAGADSDPF